MSEHTAEKDAPTYTGEQVVQAVVDALNSVADSLARGGYPSSVAVIRQRAVDYVFPPGPTADQEADA